MLTGRWVQTGCMRSAARAAVSGAAAVAREVELHWLVTAVMCSHRADVHSKCSCDTLAPVLVVAAFMQFTRLIVAIAISCCRRKLLCVQHATVCKSIDTSCLKALSLHSHVANVCWSLLACLTVHAAVHTGTHGLAKFRYVTHARVTVFEHLYDCTAYLKKNVLPPT